MRFPRAFLLCCSAVLVQPPPEVGASHRPPGQPASGHAQAQPEQRQTLTEVEARESLQQAAHLVQQGKLEQADRLARRALSNPQVRAVACSVLGVIRFEQKRLPESESYLEEAIRLEPRLVGAHLSLAQVYLLQDKPQPALVLYRRVLELDSSNAAARFAVAHAETQEGNHQRSLEIVRPILGEVKRSPEGLFLLVTNYLNTGDRVAAAALATDWFRLPDPPQALSIKFGLLFAQAGLTAEAIAVLERARQAGPPSYELEFNLGSAYVLNGDPARALDRYDAALALKPESLPTLRQAARIAERQGELERSLSYWMRAKKLEPDNPELLLGFGRVCLRMDLLEDAEPALTKAASLKPGDPSYQYTLAAAKVGKRQYEDARALLEAMVRTQPHDPHFQYALGAVLHAQGRLDEAAERLRESLRLQPDQLASRYYLALVARDQGKDAEAVEILQKLLERHPEHAPSTEVLGGLLMNAQRYPEAETHLRKAVQLNPGSVKANYQLGLLLARTGRKEEAEKQLALTKTLRAEDEKTSRLQLRLLDHDQ